MRSLLCVRCTGLDPERSPSRPDDSWISSRRDVSCLLARQASPFHRRWMENVEESKWNAPCSLAGNWCRGSRWHMNHPDRENTDDAGNGRPSYKCRAGQNAMCETVGEGFIPSVLFVLKTRSRRA